MAKYQILLAYCWLLRKNIVCLSLSISFKIVIAMLPLRFEGNEDLSEKNSSARHGPMATELHLENEIIDILDLLDSCIEAS